MKVRVSFIVREPDKGALLEDIKEMVKGELSNILDELELESIIAERIE